MPPVPCAVCKTQRALIKRPKNHQKLCKDCFISVFEDEVHHTITSSRLFYPGERVAIGASGGKDSTVLASILKTLNERHGYGLELVLLSIDEGIKGYRDDSLETVKRNSVQYDIPLKIVGYDELYGWTMDQVVAAIGKKGNCTYCGVFRRQALDRGARMLGIRHVVTGHNADDIAETVMMNLLRGDLPRLARGTSIVTGGGGGCGNCGAAGCGGSSGATAAAGDGDEAVRRSKPLKYAYEKEIVLYAHHKRLDYFSTECIYSPEAFRGSARSLIKNLERVRPSAILDIVRSGEDMARLVPGEGRAPSASCSCDAHGRPVPTAADAEDDGGSGGCGSQSGVGSAGAMVRVERKLRQDQAAADLETEVSVDLSLRLKPRERRGSASTTASTTASAATSRRGRQPPPPRKQVLRKCEKCGYMSSQAMCQACSLLEGLNKNRPQIQL